MATKSGTNAFHGTFWEFIQNDKLNARNTFSLADRAKLRPQSVRRRDRRPGRAQPHVLLRQLRGHADPIARRSSTRSWPQPAMLQGDFSGLSTRDPRSADRPAVPRQHHSAGSHLERVEVLLPVRAARRTRRRPLPRRRAGRPTTPTSTRRASIIRSRSSQRIYGRWVMNKNDQRLARATRPTSRSANETTQHNIGVNYTNTLTPTMLLTATGGYLKSDNRFTSPVVGDGEPARAGGHPGHRHGGPRGLHRAAERRHHRLHGLQHRVRRQRPPVERREEREGEPDLAARRALAQHRLRVQRPQRLRRGTGRTRRAAASTSTRQYTGDGFADYPARPDVGHAGATFRSKRSASTARPTPARSCRTSGRCGPNLTLGLGLRYEYWHAKKLRAGNGATFDPAIGKVIAGVDERRPGEPDEPAGVAVPGRGHAGPVGARQ